MFSKSFAERFGLAIFAGTGFEDDKINRFVPDEFKGNRAVLVMATELCMLVSEFGVLEAWELEMLEDDGVVMGETFAVGFAGETAAFVVSSNWNTAAFVGGSGVANRNGTGPIRGR